MNPVLTICKASAGSGKTFTLAKEFLKIVLRDPMQYNKILAITFTNKATAEMKSRIMQCLVDISRGNMKGMGEVILSELNDYDADRLRLCAGEALGFMLHDYSHLSVMTIDSFFQKIIQAFIYELKLPAGISVQIETEQVLQKAVEEVIQSYGKSNSRLSEWLKEFAFSRIDEDKNWKLSDDISVLSGELLKENVMMKNIHYSFDDVGKMSSEINDITSKFKEEIYLKALEIYQLLQRYQLERGYFSRDSIPNYLKKLGENPDSNFFTDSMLASISNTDKPPFTKAKTDAANTQIWFSEIQPLLLSFVAFYSENAPYYFTARAIQKNLYSLALLSAVKEKMDEYRSQESSMLISDSALLIHKITEGANTSFLYEKAGIFYKHILLDEFQDTSTLQWNNMLPLLIEILSSAKGKILIVGDAKQSIYRWRNGNMNLILEGVKNDLSAFWESLAVESILKGNFRSLSEVVHFNNHIFPLLGRISEAFIRERFKFNMPEYPFYSKIYAEEGTVQQSFRKAAFDGFIQGYFPLKDKESGIEQQLIYAENTIKELVANRGYQYRDITLLVRTNSQAIKLASHFTSLTAPIPVLSAEALLFSKQASVLLLTTAIRFLFQPDISLHYAALLYHYCHWHQLDYTDNLIMEDWVELSDETHISLLNQLLPAFSVENRSELYALSVPALIRKLIHVLGLQNALDIYLQQFQDAVQNFCSKTPGVSLKTFLEWWDEKSVKLSVNMPEGPDAVQILTIHKSKGLEFPVVIIPYCDWDLINAKNSHFLWVDTNGTDFNQLEYIPIKYSDAENTLFNEEHLKESIQQLADALNMTYVAFTRAAEQLYFCSVVAGNIADKPLGKISNIGQLLYYSLHLHEENGSWVQDTYQRGQLHAKVHNKEISTDIALPFNLPDKALEAVIQLRKNEAIQDERILGNLVHDVLAVIQNAEEMDEALNKISQQANIQHQWIDLARQMLSTCLSDPQMKDWFSGEYSNISEREILLNGEVLRPDKILLKDNTVILLDFKTGKPEKSHIKQIQLYTKALSSVGMTVNSAILVYIASSGLVTLHAV